MFYRVVIIANLQHEPAATHLNRVIKYLEQNAINVNTGSHNPEPTRARLEECYHDENPGQPCQLLREWQLPEQP